MDASGNLYGTTAVGGAYIYNGTVFKLTPPATSGGNWTESILRSFGNGTDGSYPLAGLITDTNGNLYGTTAGGGAYGAIFSGGTVFKLTRDGNESVLWNFGNGSDGAGPQGGLIMDTSGNLYGTTTGGGTVGEGTVFEISNVASTPRIVVTPRGIVFPNTKIGTTSTASVEVKNIGTGQLIGTVNTPPAPFGLSGSGSFNLAPKTETTITLTFTPTSSMQALRADKVVSSNAVNHSIVHIKLEGTGTP